MATLPVVVHEEPCGVAMVAVVEGRATTTLGELGPSDVLVAHHPEGMLVGGAGKVVVAEGAPIAGCSPTSRPAPRVHFVRGRETPAQTWASSTMSAWLDVPRTLSEHLYLGRLAGTASVPEHAHEGSWEILAAIEASGTIVHDGAEARLTSGEVVVVPAGTKHAWRPDPGSRLVGVQLYWPPGPEERFRALADEAKSAKDPR